MSCRCFSMRSLSPARWAYRRRAPMNFCMRTVSHRFGSAAGLSYRRNSSVSGWSDRREAHMKNKYLPARVSRVWRLCPIFRAQPGACPPEAQNRTLRRRAGALAENARIGKNGSGKSHLRQMQENAENGQNRGILGAAARKQDKAAGSCAPRGGHICPRCGQFRGFTRAFQTQRKTAGGRCGMKKARRFKGNRGVPTKFTR